MSAPKTHILYTVLDWGLGHATRSIPVIRTLLAQGVRISIAGNGDSFHLLKKEFPELQAFEVPGIQVRYPAHVPLSLSLLMQFPRNLFELSREKKAFRELTAQLRPDAVISDNRYGAYIEGVPSAIITHQLCIRVPLALFFLRPVVQLLNWSLLRKFSEIWVPDSPAAPGLSGQLSHHPATKKRLNVFFTGQLSRLTDVTAVKADKRYNILVLLSGPEPQRSTLETALVRELSMLKKKVLLVRGKPMDQAGHPSYDIEIVPHLPAALIKYHLLTTPVVICRPGYSTLMDLASTGRSAICIPTPGQTEQEYLASIHSKNKLIVRLSQNRLRHLPEAIEKLKNCTPFEMVKPSGLLEQHIKDFLSRIRK